MPTSYIQASSLPLVLQLMLASEKIGKLQARVFDFPLIFEHLSKHVITIEQIQTFNFREIYTLENWLSQKYLRKIPTLDILLENLENPKFFQALCFPSLFEMYSAWFGYCRTIDFESMIINLDFFTQYESFRYSFTYFTSFALLEN